MLLRKISYVLGEGLARRNHASLEDITDPRFPAYSRNGEGEKDSSAPEKTKKEE
jgi:hypothetical protein